MIKNQFLRIPSARILLVDNGVYKLSDVYVDADDGKTLFARISEGEYAKLGTKPGEFGDNSTSVPTLFWNRISGIDYSPKMTIVELVGGEVFDTINERLMVAVRQETTFPED